VSKSKPMMSVLSMEDYEPKLEDIAQALGIVKGKFPKMDSKEDLKNEPDEKPEDK